MRERSREERCAAIIKKMEKIDRLDLAALTEFKRSGNGAVEIRLLDRVAALEKILELLGDREEEKTEAFFRALEGAGNGMRDGVEA